MLPGPVVEQGDVHLSGMYLLRSGGEQRLTQTQLHALVPAQWRRQQGSKRHGGGRKRCDGDHSQGDIGLFGKDRFGRFHERQDLFALRDQKAARIGQFGPAWGPVEQRHPRLTLESGQLLGYGRRRVTERVRGGRDGAPQAEFTEKMATSKIEHKNNLSSASKRRACTDELVWAG